MPVSLSQFFPKLRPFPSKSEKTAFAANGNAKSFLCMQKVRENGQNFKTSRSNSPPLSNAPPHGRLRTSNSLLPGEDLKSNSRDMPGGMLKFRIDRYISNTFAIDLKSVSTFSYAESNGGIFILIAPLGITNTRTNVVRVICQQYVLRAICQQYNFA